MLAMSVAPKQQQYPQHYANMQTELRFLANQIKNVIEQNPTLPNANNLEKMLDFMMKLSHSFFDLQMHNIGLLEENRELYRQLELASSELEKQTDEIALLQSEIQQLQENSNVEVDLFNQPYFNQSAPKK